MNPIALKAFLLSGFLFFTGLSYGQDADKAKIEQQLLEQARANIEKYRKADAKLVFTDANGKALRNVQVEVNQVTQDFLFGNLSEEVFNPSLTAEEVDKFEKHFTGLFNFTELTIKWSPYESKQGMPQWEKLQQKLDWCKKFGVTPKGHTLGWTNTSGTPSYIMGLPLDLSYDLYKARIFNLVRGFKSQITMWDVVNEPVTTIPWEMAIRDTISEAKIAEGSRYKVAGITMEQIIPWVEKSLRWAYEADPEGDMMINEFFILAKPEVRRQYFELIQELQRRNVPLTGIGIQGHEPHEMWFSPVEIVKTYDQYQALGIPLHITELIPQSSMKEITGGWREGLWTEEAQAEFAEQFYILSFGHPAIASVHWWGLTDKMIWLEGGGLLDSNLNPKPVYHRLQKLIRGEWMTRNLALKTDRKGEVAFRGFFGNYEVTVAKPDGSKQQFRLHLAENTPASWAFILD